MAWPGVVGGMGGRLPRGRGGGGGGGGAVVRHRRLRRGVGSGSRGAGQTTAAGGHPSPKRALLGCSPPNVRMDPSCVARHAYTSQTCTLHKPYLKRRQDVSVSLGSERFPPLLYVLENINPRGNSKTYHLFDPLQHSHRETIFEAKIFID